MPGRELGERGLARRERWPRYIAGMLTETLYVFALTLAAYLIAALAIVLAR
jgi:hypothetical protein